MCNLSAIENRERAAILSAMTMSRPDPCSVDFGREAPDLNFAVDFLVDFFVLLF